MNNLTTDQTKEALSFLFDLSDAIRSSLAGDGKITISDAPKFLTPIRSAGKGIGGIQEVPKEISDLTEDELKDLTAFVSERFDIPNETLENKVENCLKYAGLLALSIKELYDLKK